MKRFTKPAVALVSAAAMLFLLAAPSSAATGTVNSGTVGVNLTPALSVTLGTGTTGCAASTLTVANGGSGAIAIGITQGAFDYGTPNPHVLVANATGTYSTTLISGTTYSVSGSMSTTATGTTTARIFARTGTCTATATTECGPIVTTITVNSTTSTFTGDITTMTGTAVINASGTLSAFGCAAPFSAINGKIITITNMNVSLA
ncbi:MAG TPA: hypothetical protein VF228_12635 [Iamia sp.]